MSKPYYDEDGITIYHGDCREIGPKVSASIVCTDPPYGINKAEWDSRFDLSVFNLLAPLTIALMPGISNLCQCPQRLAGLPFRWCLSAYLSNGMTRGAIGFGNWIPCLLYSSSSLYKKEGDAKAFTVEAGNKPDHPSPKPYPVMRWIVGKLPNDGAILDPYMGSGTTLLAAKNLGREAIGIEIEERYCEIAAKRLSQQVMQFDKDSP